MSDDLVMRLRAVDHMSVEDCFVQSPLFEKAAARIEELQKERDEALGRADRNAAIADDAEALAAALLARIKELEKAWNEAIEAAAGVCEAEAAAWRAITEEGRFCPEDEPLRDAATAIRSLAKDVE